MIFVPPSQHGDGERPAGPILIALLFVAVLAGVTFYRKNGGEFSIEGFHPGAAMWIVASLGISLAVVAGVVAVQRSGARARGPSIESRLADVEAEVAELRAATDTQLNAMSQKLDDATRAGARSESDR